LRRQFHERLEEEYERLKGGWSKSRVIVRLAAVPSSRTPVVALAILLTGCDPLNHTPKAATSRSHSFRLHIGDHPQGSFRSLDDSAWEVLDLAQLPQRQGLYWIRGKVDISTSPQPFRPLGIRFSVLGSREIFWDGALIGRSGVVGQSQPEEVPGLIDEPFVVPAELSNKGGHLLAIRVSNFHYGSNLRGSFYGLEIEDYNTLVTAPLREGIVLLLPLGGFAILALSYALRFALGGRRVSDLLFCALALSALILLTAEAWRWVVGYTYARHTLRLMTQAAAAATIGLLLPLYFLHEFSIPKRTVWASVALFWVAAASWLPAAFDTKKSYTLAGSLAISAVIVCWAVALKRLGSAPAMGGLTVCLLLMLAAPADFGELRFFFGFAALAVGMVAASVLRAREQQRQAQSAELRAVQLEAQLLKRSIQPHFLMNTLTAILEWVEVEPKRASRFIEALADEFRLLSEVSKQRTIALPLEVELCRAHLSVMSLRLEIPFSLRTSGVEASSFVPPAVFHTLVENGLTHGAFTPAHSEFELEVTRDGSRQRYRFLSPESRAAFTESRSEGTGLRYVRARLEESFPGRWTLTNGATVQGWETVIWIADDGGARSPS
jgi:hypothetical protein